MLIEAAKGGHVNVVNLLLDWSANTAGSQSSNSPVVEPSQASPSQLYPLDFEQVSTHQHLACLSPLLYSTVIIVIDIIECQE